VSEEKVIDRQLYECICNGWKNGMPQIEGSFKISILNHGAKFRGEHFKFCPWCGKELKAEDLPETTRKILEGTI
jgi:hypothetical protein